MLDTSDWKPFRIGDLFVQAKSGYVTKNPDGTQRPKKIGTATKEPDEEHTVPLTCAKKGNSGVGYWGRPGDYTTQKECLAVIADGAVAAGLVYSHPDEVGVYSHSYLIKLKEQPERFEDVGLFLATVMTKVIYPQFSRDDSPRWQRIEDIEIMLPALDDGTPDWTYMANYVAGLRSRFLAHIEPYMPN